MTDPRKRLAEIEARQDRDHRWRDVTIGKALLPADEQQLRNDRADLIAMLKQSQADHKNAVAGWEKSVDHNTELRARITKLETALTQLLNHYVSLVESGDAGFLDCEKEDVVIQARAALAECDDEQ